MPRLTAIVAMSSNRVIGDKGSMPWHFPEDLKFFKHTTLGHPILMGRVTFDSIGKPLPGRQNIVLSHAMAPREGVTVIRQASELATACPDAKQIFVIGGAQVFAEMLPQCDGLYLTYIEQPFDGDTSLPPFEDLFTFKEVVGRAEGLEFRYYERKAD